MSQPIPLAYTFGNHMHWVDMQWLWGYHVLPGSVRDMLAFCDATGAKGNVNFDGIGYEKMAAEAPEALAELKAAILEGRIEPVGCSYGQPYGLFHGGESNVRQRVYGARTVRRLLGVWPKTFWEEEFDFFPQLPQMLRGCGFEYASLYFQWTWHTPEIPKEDVPVIWWEGVDGSTLKCATRNRLNLHQWPEDFQALLDDLASEADGAGSELPNSPTALQESGQECKGAPLILQWLELMPSPDWMCRSELMIPKLLELKRDKRFSVSFATLGEYLSQAHGPFPVRRYGMGDVWHGMSLGKNADGMRLWSAEVECQAIETEALAATVSLWGRPYAQWDVYPVWELEEAWRELLQAQHHDNDECEDLCGRVGLASYSRARDLLWRVETLQVALLQEEKPRACTWSHWPGVVPCEKTAPQSAKDAARQLVLSGADRIREWSEKGEVIGAWIDVDFIPKEPGMNRGVRMPLELPFEPSEVWCDTPYTIVQATPYVGGLRKYPEGDWMTSPQWFETVDPNFTANRFVDFVADEGWGVMVVQDRTRCWFRKSVDEYDMLVTMLDPWDEIYHGYADQAHCWFVPHGPWSHRDRRLEVLRICRDRSPRKVRGGSPPAIAIQSSGSTLEAFYRESEDFSGMHVDNYAGKGMGYPFVLRLVEWNGEPDEVELDLYGTVARAYKTNLLGQIESELEPEPAQGRTLLRIPMRPHEIATLYLDIVEGRKVPRDLDAHRDKWATVHRVPSQPEERRL